MMFTPRPLLLREKLKIQCPVCKRIVSEGCALIVFCEGTKATSFLPDVDLKHCRKCLKVPKLFETMSDADFEIKLLRAGGPDQILPIAPLEDLSNALRSIGTTVEAAKAFIAEALASRV